MTIYDIAKIAGVSPSSVSRVINNKPGINEENRKRIQEILKQYNYTPNEAARGLVMQSTKIIGILMEDIRMSHHTESTYVVEQELMKHGYTCIALSTGHDVERKVEFIKLLEQRRVEGVILMGSMFCIPQVEEAIRSHLSDVPVVIVNGYLNLPNVYGILIDERGGVESCVELLAGKGRRRLVFVVDTPSPANERKKDGFLEGMKALGAEEKDIPVYYGNPSDFDPELMLERGKELTRTILAERPETEGIIYSVDLLAIGGIMGLEEMGRKVPEDVAVIGIDNTLFGKISRPSLSTLDNKLVEVSQNASGILLRALEKERVTHKIMLFTDIIERQSS
ncbi:MAG: LacI family DNA-binding transcriptional regulator [Lachnospiraceae bacterium]|nr:LacI family DNA-binding transcriptional regulator [Lachnospiraceae bacterium]